MVQIAEKPSKRATTSKRPQKQLQPQPLKDLFGPTLNLDGDEDGKGTVRPMITLPLGTILASSGPDSLAQRRALHDVSLAVARCRRAVVISGAGISCSSGIPDFRSNDGLYNLVKERYPDAFFTGKDLFSSGLFNAPETTSLFYTFIAELALSCTKAQPTRTHHFIHRLHTKGKLLRSYTQNIDGLERRVGLESGGRGNGLKKMSTMNVEMHGDLGRVRCVLCIKDFEAREEWMEMFREGNAPWCPACEERCEGRVNRAARALPIGSLRPSIVLYDEPHPLGEEIGGLQAYDLGRRPDILLVMGTSLKVHGLKRVVREFAKAVHAKKGLVVFINLTPPTKEWEDVIDVHIQGETDAWVNKVEEDWKHARPTDWELQTRLEGDVIKNTPAIKSKAKSKPIAVGKAKATKKSTKAAAPRQQLPTPRPSHSPPRFNSSSFTRADESEDELTPPSSPLSSAPSSPVMAPLTPSKRRFNAPPSPVSEIGLSPSKKRTLSDPIPHTGVPATPGRGNLFSSGALECPTDLENENDPNRLILVAPRSPGDKENVRPRRAQITRHSTRNPASIQTAGVKPKERAIPKRREKRYA